MKKLFFFLLILLNITNKIVSQVTVLNYPYKLERASLLKKNEAHINFIENIYSGKIIVTLFDYAKAEYVELDSNFKIISKFNVDRNSTVSKFDYKRHIGATIGTDIYYNVYKVIDKEVGKLENYFVERISFTNKTTSSKKLLELPEDEKMLTSFSDYGVFYAFTANNASSSICLYELKANGELFKKNFPITVPENAGRKRSKLTDYLDNIKLVKTGTEPWLPETGSESKIYSFADKICLSVNLDNNAQTRLIWIDKKNYTLSENQIDHSSLVEKGEFLNSFLLGDKLFVFIPKDNAISLAVYDRISGKLLKLQEINDANMSLLAEVPVDEERYEFRNKLNDFSSIKKFIKSINKGYKGLFVLPNAKGQLVITMGNFYIYPKTKTTYQMNSPQKDAISGSHWESQYTTTASTFFRTFYVPAEISYNTNYLKLIIDATTFEPRKGPIPKSARKSVNEFLSKFELTQDRLNAHFSIKDKHYFSFYDSKSNNLVVSLIPIIN